MCEPRNGSNGCGMLTRPPWRWISSAVSLCVRPRGIVFVRKSPTTSPSAVDTSSPRMTVSRSVEAELRGLVAHRDRALHVVVVRDRHVRQAALEGHLDELLLGQDRVAAEAGDGCGSRRRRAPGAGPAGRPRHPAEASRSSCRRSRRGRRRPSGVAHQALAERAEVLERQAGPDRDASSARSRRRGTGCRSPGSAACRGCAAATPPPVITIPLSMMSELSSGGVCSSTLRTAVMIAGAAARSPR